MREPVVQCGAMWCNVVQRGANVQTRRTNIKHDLTRVCVRNLRKKSWTVLGPGYEPGMRRAV